LPVIGFLASASEARYTSTIAGVRSGLNERLLDKTANCFRTGQLSILAPDPGIQSGKLGRL
jgi:hypothetical protein